MPFGQQQGQDRSDSEGSIWKKLLPVAAVRLYSRSLPAFTTKNTVVRESCLDRLAHNLREAYFVLNFLEISGGDILYIPNGVQWRNLSSQKVAALDTQ